MRALRRLATPASFAAALSGCTYPFEDYLPRTADAALATNQDVAREDSGTFEAAPDVSTAETSDETAETSDETADARAPDDTAVTDTRADDTAIADSSPDAPVDACVCVKYAGPKCKDWSPPGCGD